MTFAVFQGIGIPELLIVLGIVLLIFGPKRLPMLGRQLGSGLREFKESVTKRHSADDELPEGEATEVTGEVVPERERST